MRESLSPQQVLKILSHSPAKTFRLRDLVVELGLRSSQARELKRILEELARERRIVSLRKSHYALAYKGRRATGKARPGAPDEETRSLSSNIVAGRVIGHRDGYGFVVPDVPDERSAFDIYIPPDGMGTAMHGDRVEVRITRSKADGRLQGRIVRICERAQRTVVGVFHAGRTLNYVVPFDRRIPLEIVIPRGHEWPDEDAVRQGPNRQFGGESEVEPIAASRRKPQDLDGSIVDVEITSFPKSAERPRGRVIEILGRRDEFGVDVEIIIRKFHLPHRFPAEVLAEAAAVPQFIPERDRDGRRDFRELPIVTIDGETAKDFDDAVYVERLPGGNYRLQVHIADVAHYVRPGTALDREARLRGTSVYFPDRAVPMLPLELSNGICSLNPHADRLVMSALMEIDGEGRVIGYELLPGIIRSAERMTYTAVRDVLVGDPVAAARYRSHVQSFKLMQELALILNRARERRGSIDFDLPEPLIEFDESGRMIGITRSERNIAHRIIEEFMLCANETVASYLAAEGVPSLYRIHEKPDPKKLLEFEEIAASFGYSLGVEFPHARRLLLSKQDERNRYPRFLERMEGRDIDITPRHYQRLTKRLEGKPEERILSYLMLRSLKQARYSEENLGHFALAASTYTHFTSPIRRYPDLVVHRILKAVLAQKSSQARVGKIQSKSQALPSQGAAPTHAGSLPVRSRYPGAVVPLQELHALGVETSEAERRAADAERELMEWKKVSYMAGRLGDEFDALIISLTKHGFFIELTDLFVEGFVPVANFVDDHYVYRESLRAIVGQHSRKAFRLGGRVRVRLDRIDRSGNKLEFSVVE
jgi:ribonuclease R